MKQRQMKQWQRTFIYKTLEFSRDFLYNDYCVRMDEMTDEEIDETFELLYFLYDLSDYVMDKTK